MKPRQIAGIAVAAALAAVVFTETNERKTTAQQQVPATTPTAAEPTPLPEAVAQKPHKAPIDDLAYQPIKEADSPKLYRSWGKDGIDRINAAVKSAVEITSTSPKCDRVTIGGYSFDRSDPKNFFSVFTDCLNGERFYFTEEETKSAAASEARSLSDSLSSISDSTALGQCEDLAKAQLRFPSTMDASWLNSTVDRQPFGINVALAFEAKNAMGAMLPQLALCVINDQGGRLLSIRDR